VRFARLGSRESHAPVVAAACGAKGRWCLAGSRQTDERPTFRGNDDARRAVRGIRKIEFSRIAWSGSHWPAEGDHSPDRA
jgi:hypothetical protein